MSSQSPGIGSALPDMNANTSAQVLTNDGVTASWEAVTSLGLPPMGGNSGKYLTTNGTAASWGAVTADGILPSQTGKSGQVLSTNGTTVSWAAASGVSLGAFSSSPSTDGLTLSSGTLNLDPADGTHPGGVSTTTQTFGGAKTFSSITFGTPTSTLVAPLRVKATGSDTASLVLEGTGGIVNPKLTLQSVSGAAGAVDIGSDGDYQMTFASGAANCRFNLAAAGGLDLTGIGNSGSIKLKDDAGATKTCTISGGVWVIT